MTSASLSDIEKKFNREIAGAETPEKLDAVQREYLGRKGVFNALLENIKDLSPEQKQKFGQDVNQLKRKIQGIILAKKIETEDKALADSIGSQKIDGSLPGYPISIGHLHVVNQVSDEIIRIFAAMGFALAEGPEIETDENNFDRLNIPEDHPAKDMHDTFYLDLGEKKRDAKFLLRTHTSPVQIREMLQQKRLGSFPVRLIAPGKVYRHEAIDSTHSSVFHQVEGLVVDRGVSFADLKGTLEIFVKRFFGGQVKTRFQPSFFPFVEPGAEMYISCTICGGKNAACPVCKGSGWLEMLGAGMVHPNVFKAVGYDPEEYTGFAFGMGIERIAMVRHGISDMRLFYENHLDFLSQF